MDTKSDMIMEKSEPATTSKLYVQRTKKLNIKYMFEIGENVLCEI